MDAPSQPKEYLDVHALLIYFTADWDAEKNARQLGRACKSLGYDVTRFKPDDDLGLVVGHNPFEDTMLKLEAWIRSWISQTGCSRFAMENREHLFLIYFGGQGGTWLHDDGQHLVGSYHDGSEVYEISLTRIQQLVRDETAMDLVCLFECFNADENDLKPLQNGDERYEPNQIIETLAAGEGDIRLLHEPDEFSQRFANDLFTLPSRPGPARTVKGVFERVHDEQIDLSPGHYVCNQGRPSITLPVLPDIIPLTDEDNDTVYDIDDFGENIVEGEEDESA